MTSLASRLKLGRLWYRIYHRPKGQLTATWKRGVVNSTIDRWQHQQMKKAALHLPALPEFPGQEVTVHFLTGQRFLHQTAFCAWSLSQYGNVRVKPVLHDDGSLKDADLSSLRKLFPGLVVHLESATNERLDQWLPVSRYPHLRKRRSEYPNLRKLMDVHAGEQGWKLVLDSDMLFFRSPTRLLEWLRDPQRPCHMIDSVTSYGYPMDFLARQCGHQLAEKVNVGITGLCSDQIPWDELERWIREQNTTYGPHYFQEQALIAQLIAGTSPDVMPASDYICQPMGDEARDPQGIMHHYVADSKPAYFRSGWRHCLQRAGAVTST